MVRVPAGAPPAGPPAVVGAHQSDPDRRRSADLAAVMPGSADGIILPKADSAAEAITLGHYLSALEAREGLLPESTHSSRGHRDSARVFRAGSYHGASARIVRPDVGAEDLPRRSAPAPTGCSTASTSSRTRWRNRFACWRFRRASPPSTRSMPTSRIPKRLLRIQGRQARRLFRAGSRSTPTSPRSSTRVHTRRERGGVRSPRGGCFRGRRRRRRSAARRQDAGPSAPDPGAESTRARGAFGHDTKRCAPYFVRQHSFGKHPCVV